ncbi:MULTISPECIES: RelA/SpoT domain-containing protein [Vibrio]|uniref:RelA/SpoT domain-containing protein n=1 Tax=Vibrio TaxID=662 RepID=UPI001EEF801A|nr:MULTISPECIES: RelA/SpoT domain-containing protein [Vibrio]MCF7510393.1 RelA/SpoT domain-containing protein [Vibrio sp. D54]MCG6322158.1 RelA/SpoT domain-containing protein [Vibrio alginolyticus]MDW1497183.1 RelA/SpoT domain-containing protein [Vibrio sp. YT-19(2023)]
MNQEENFEGIQKKLEEKMHFYELLHDKIISLINRDPVFKKYVHSYKSRFKDIEHLREKIARKNEADSQKPEEEQNGPITPENVTERITDICGIRILHLYQNQFSQIHQRLMSLVETGELALYEDPKAYTWDPEFEAYFKELDLEAELKESFYTSVHYVFKPRADSDITCELQVRTLFEEVWGEIDHTFNYPVPSDSIVIQEQLKVLARLVGAGTRLSDSIFRLKEHN